MHRVFKWVLVGAAALLATVACRKEQTIDNPNYNPETNEVLTSFVFNVATAQSPQTKMTSGNTQATSSDAFRGIEKAHLLSFIKGTPVADGKYITASTTAANKHYDMGNVMSTSDATTDQTKSHRIIELALPTETNTLMFYGKAPKSGENSNFAQGSIKYLAQVTNTNATDLSKYDFELNRIVEINTDGYSTKYRQYGDLMAAALNYICAAEIVDKDVQFESTHTITSLKWTQFVTISDAGVVKVATVSPLYEAPLSALGEIVADALATLATIPAGEVRAGSGPAISRTMGDLYTIMNKVHEAIPTSVQESQVKALADEIMRRIDACFEGTAPSLKWRDYSTVVSAIGYSGSTDQISRIGNTGSALEEFPMIAFNLPAGCAQIKATNTESTQNTLNQVTTPGTITWSYIKDVQMFDTIGGTSCYNVFYPAELCYFGDSPVRVTKESVVESEYPQGVSAWDTESSWTSKQWVANSHVVSTTRSVAMQYNINYGTALLKSNIAYTTTTLKDNNHAIQLGKNPSLSTDEEPDAEITVTDATIKLRGILIGGVNPKVGWNFLPIGTDYKNAIYDKAIVSDAIPATGTSADNYTLVWDNWNEAQRGAKQNDVYICLELENNSGKDFWGKHNIVRNGGIFYLIGKLDPDAGRSATDRSEGVTWPNNGLQALPPFDTDGSTLKERHVFMQDFMTTANFKLGEDSLKNAYSTVPDLRSSQISLGLSVDLKWETGLVFNVTL
ncbi:MAG: hypothetical protein J6W74_02610 [Bacteroidales bacterium]|nr:hypothetical protein [Bacteroidales bacterium]